MVTIEIDGKPYQAQPGQMLIEITDAAGIEVPRFCYHRKLSVAANCRMCLVEIEKAPKPMPACATPVTNGMKVFTRSPKALMAQKAVMEFLLINHPLDCPICDQGGECELQDLAVGYGNDGSRYEEQKRAVADKNLGPLIATEMTRCIHCTRCVRFGEEIAGFPELGATGRGERTRIGTYIEKSVASELSGNVIDLCPVGALTSKPFRFAARGWEMQQYESVAPHDAVGSNVYLHVRRGQLLRVVPKENEAINEVWLSDRDRFSYAGINAPDRLTSPMIKQDGGWQTVDWETALQFAAEGLRKVTANHGGTGLAGLAAPGSTVEEHYLLQKLLRGLGSSNLDHRLTQADFSDQEQAPLFPALGMPIAELEQCDAVLLIGSHLRKEQPLLNHRLRKAAVKRKAAIMALNPLAYEWNFPLAAQLTAAPAELPKTLAGIAKAALQGQDMPQNLQKLLAEVEPTPEQQAVAEKLRNGERKLVLLGELATAHPRFSALRALAAILAQATGATLGYASGNSAGAWLAGMLPHRGAAGTPARPAGIHAGALLTQGVPGYVLLGVEPELDSRHGAAAAQTLWQAEFIVSLTAYRTPAMDGYAHVLLPIALYPETSGTYVNAEGLWQSFNGAVNPPGEARPAWKVLRVLGNLMQVAGFDYTGSDQARDELRQAVDGQKAGNANAWQMPADLEMLEDGSLQRITEMPLYAVDALTRRSAPLQHTPDAGCASGAHVHPQLAAKLGLAPGKPAKIQQAGGETVELQIIADERVPESAVLIYAAQPESLALSHWHGSLSVTPASS